MDGIEPSHQASLVGLYKDIATGFLTFVALVGSIVMKSIFKTQEEIKNSIKDVRDAVSNQQEELKDFQVSTERRFVTHDRFDAAQAQSRQDLKEFRMEVMSGLKDIKDVLNNKQDKRP